MIVSIVLYSELRELESRLGELQVKTEIKSLEEGNKENTEAIQSKLKSFRDIKPIGDVVIKILLYRPWSCVQGEAGSL